MFKTLTSDSGVAWPQICSQLKTRKNTLTNIIRMSYALLPMFLNLIICWVWLQMFYIGIPWRTMFRRRKPSDVINPEDEKERDRANRVREALGKHYENLGSMKFHETAVLLLFITLVLLWFFREPEFIVGWGDLFHTR